MFFIRLSHFCGVLERRIKSIGTQVSDGFTKIYPTELGEAECWTLCVKSEQSELKAKNTRHFSVCKFDKSMNCQFCIIKTKTWESYKIR
jgi:hypothetical protein